MERDDLIQYLPLGVVLLIILRRSGRAQKVNVERGWITPALSAFAIWSQLSREPTPGAAAIAIFAVAALIGIGAGYFRALHIELTRDPLTGEVMSKATQFGTILIVVFLLLRSGLGYLVKGSLGPGIPHPGQLQKHGVDIFRLADALTIFATVMLVAQRLEILRRAHLLLRSGGSAAPAPDGQP
jgi:hypothetical protein